MLAMSLRGATRRPLVFVFEDLLVLATHRLGYSPPFGTRSFATRLTLNPLSETDAVAMAGRMLGVDRFPADVTRALLDKAAGVPLFVEEVTKTFFDLGILERDNGGLRVARPLAEAAVPDTINDIIMARLDRLGDDGKRTVHHPGRRLSQSAGAAAQGAAVGRGLRYSVLAGDRAAHAYASAEARKHYAQALAVAGRARRPPDERELASVHEKLGAVLSILAEFDQAVTEPGRALALLRQAGDRPWEMAMLLARAGVHVWAHKPVEVLVTLEKALAIAEEIGDTAGQAGCHALRGESLSDVYGPTEEAMRDSSKALRLAREAGTAASSRWPRASTTRRGHGPSARSRGRRSAASASTRSAPRGCRGPS